MDTLREDDEPLSKQGFVLLFQRVLAACVVGARRYQIGYLIEPDFKAGIEHPCGFVLLSGAYSFEQ